MKAWTNFWWNCAIWRKRRKHSIINGVLKKFLAPLLLTAFTFLIYFPVLDNFFIFDDTHWILAAENFRWTWKDFLSVPLIYFRPLIMILFWLQTKWFGINPPGYYAVFIFFHAVNTCLVFFSAQAIAASQRFPNPYIPGYLSAFLFSISFTHSAAVLVISATMHNVLTTFYLCSSIFFMSYCSTGHRAYLLFLIVSHVLGLLTDLPMLTLPALLICLFLLCDKRKKLPLKLFAGLSLILLILDAFYIICYLWVIRGKGYHVTPSSVASFFQTFASFLIKIFLETLGFIKEGNIVNDSILFLPLLNGMVFLYFFCTLFRQNGFSTRNAFFRSLAFYVFSFFISAFPYVFVKGNDMFSYNAWTRYRYSYLTSAFFCMLIGSVVYQGILTLSKTRAHFIAVALAAMFLSSSLALNYRGVVFAEKTYDLYGKLDKWVLSNVNFLCRKNLKSNTPDLWLVNFPELPQVAMNHPHLENLIRFYIRRDVNIRWLSENNIKSIPAGEVKSAGCVIRYNPINQKFVLLLQ